MHTIDVEPLCYPVGSTSHVTGTCVKPIVAKLTAYRHVLESTGEVIVTPVSNVGRAPVCMCVDQASVSLNKAIQRHILQVYFIIPNKQVFMAFNKW